MVQKILSPKIFGPQNLLVGKKILVDKKILLNMFFGGVQSNFGSEKDFGVEDLLSSLVFSSHPDHALFLEECSFSPTVLV